MGAPAIFEIQIEIKLLHPASTEGVTDSGIIFSGPSLFSFFCSLVTPMISSVLFSIPQKHKKPVASSQQAFCFFIADNRSANAPAAGSTAHDCASAAG
ncbi:MAG: hypothetical protein P8X74_16450 [Reinekea sp.]